MSQFQFDGKCSSVGCNGNITEVRPEELSKNNHFAHLYASERMSPLFIKEHTAQLSRKESADYQEQFVKKEINALSCSTTFEMGVDVGDLETVFLRDVPPLPSNYAQRAGRAGRSVNAAAYALTYAKLSSHDLYYFTDPKKMISGTIQPPLFKVDNEKIVRRHIYAIALSMFFAEHEEMYNGNNARLFINEKGYEAFIAWLASRPERLKNMIKRSIPDIDGLHSRLGVEDFGWVEEFSGENGIFTQLINEYEKNVEEFNEQIARLVKAGEFQKAGVYQRKMGIYTTNQLIDFLARGNILPRYGFPVDTVELQPYSVNERAEDKLRLTRDLQIAIAEYAPSSEVIANGRMYTSRYIRKSPNETEEQGWHIAYIGSCNNTLPDGTECGALNYTPVTAEDCKCSSCKQKLDQKIFHESIEPRNGFVAEEQDKNVPMTVQEKNYRSEDYYIGASATPVEKYRYQFSGIQVKVESTTDDPLLVKSTNNFYVCPVCGFTYAADESIGDKKAEKDMKNRSLSITLSKGHKGLFSECPCKKFSRRSLHHVFRTDVTKITFFCPTDDYKTMVSVMYAILYAISSELNIERRDIKACLSLRIEDRQKHYSIIIYDAVPGGAGHARRLVTEDGKMLYRIMQSALRRVSECTCDPSCYNCLRSYDNQMIHDKLDRHLARGFLEKLLISGSYRPLDEQEATDFGESNTGTV